MLLLLLLLIMIFDRIAIGITIAIVVEMTIAGAGAVFPLEFVVFGHDLVPTLVHGLETDGGLVDAMLVLEDGGGKARVREGERNSQRVRRRVSAPGGRRMGGG